MTRIVGTSAVLAAFLLTVPADGRAEENTADPNDESDHAPQVADDSPEQEQAKDLSGWFRVDTDSSGTHFWFGTTYEVGGFNLASDLYVVGSAAELDIGPSFSLGDVTLTPMAGLTFDFKTTNVTTLVAPQLYTIWRSGELYFESWIQALVKSVFTEGSEDQLYSRNFLLYAANKNISVGPQLEITYRTNDVMAGTETREAGVASLPVGGRINLADGQKNTLGVFLGYETKRSGAADGIASRFTFIHNW